MDRKMWRDLSEERVLCNQRTLAPSELLGVHAARGASVTIDSGMVWMTEHKLSRGAIVRGGETRRIDGEAMIQALGPAVITITTADGTAELYAPKADTAHAVRRERGTRLAREARAWWLRLSRRGREVQREGDRAFATR